MRRNAMPFLIPLATLLLAWLLFARSTYLSATQQELLVMAPYFLAAVALLSSYHFRRGRVFLLVLLSAVGYYLLHSYPPAGLATPRACLVYWGLAFLLPFNLFVVALMREKGISGSSARMRLLFLAGQLLVLWITLQQDSQTLWVVLTKPLIQTPLLTGLAIPQPSLLLLCCAAVVAVWKVWQQPSPVEGAVFGVALGFGALFSWPSLPFVVPVFSGAVSLVLLLAIIQESHNMAFRDDMTGLPSRRALNELLRGLGNQYAIAMVDVDHFKRFNDTYGHDVGDQVLKMVAGRLMGVSGSGRSFRYGGEEFTVVFPGKDSREALQHLEQLRKEIEAYRMVLRSADRPKDDARGSSRRTQGQETRSVSVTVSIGVADAKVGTGPVEAVLKQADQALYRAKHAGRNQVCLAGGRR